MNEAQRTVGRTMIEDWYRAAIAAVEPGAAVRRFLARSGRDLVVDGGLVPVPGRLIVISVGKAAVTMARGAEQVCGDRIDDAFVLTKDGHLGETRLQSAQVREAAHPVLDERGIRATGEILQFLSGLQAGDVVLALISGGGSALLESPRPPVTMTDLGITTDLLLRAGAPIQELNAVRMPLSRVKGGGLRRAAGDARMVTLIVSDVAGNDPGLIASGPTIDCDVSAERALSILRRYDLEHRVPETVRTLLLESQTQKRPPWPDAAREDLLRIVADNAAMVESVASVVEASGLRPMVVWRDHGGEAAALGRAWVDACQSAPPEVQVLLGGGEAVVTVSGDGIGGRNTEFALGSALALTEAKDPNWLIASLASDGQDGPTAAAGAIADAGTCARAAASGVNPQLALEANDSLRVFLAAGGLVTPGPTGTNVNDLYIAVRSSALERIQTKA